MQREKKDKLNPLSFIVADPEVHTFEEAVFNVSALIRSKNPRPMGVVRV